MLRPHRITLLLAGVAALACIPTTSALATTLIVDDSFADGDRAATGPLQANFFASSTSNAIESNAGSVGLVSGGSGRQIPALFPTQTLANAGDTLLTSLTFMTPATVASGNEDLRFGIFDNLGRTSASELGQDPSYSSGSPNAFIAARLACF